MSRAVLDASAILAILLDEPGADAARCAALHGIISAVNHAEVVSRLIDRPFTVNEAREMLSQFTLDILNFDQDLAFRTGLLRQKTRALGLSLGDRACLALAMREELPVFTADRRWMELDVGVDIRLAR